MWSLLSVFVGVSGRGEFLYVHFGYFEKKNREFVGKFGCGEGEFCMFIWGVLREKRECCYDCTGINHKNINKPVNKEDVN